MLYLIHSVLRRGRRLHSTISVIIIIINNIGADSGRISASGKDAVLSHGYGSRITLDDAWRSDSLSY
jgi:hypothetical protein